MFQWKIHHLEDAYQIARDYEEFLRGPIFPESTKIPILSPKQEPSQTNPGQLDLSPPMTCDEDKDEIPEIQQTLYIDEVEKEEPEPIEETVEVEIYEADESLVDEYEGEGEEFEPSDLPGEAGCSLTQTEIKEDYHRTDSWEMS